MAKVEDCPGFETFGADVKAARKARRLTRKALAEIIGIEWRYLANIENKGTLPSLPVVIQLIKTCGLPVERYFNPEVLRSESEQRQRVGHKLNSQRRKKRGMPENHPLFSFVCEGRGSVLYFFALFFWKVPLLRVV